MDKKQAIDSNKDYLIGTLAYGLYWMDESLQVSLEAAGWPRMNRTRSMLMLYITAGIKRPIQLARTLGVSRQAIHQLLREMVTDGLVDLVPDPRDQRAKIVEFRPETKHMRRDAEHLVRAIECELKRRIGAAAFAKFKLALNAEWGPVYVAKL